MSTRLPVGRPEQGPTCATTADTIATQKAELTIDIIVIGASVSGLACAYSLRQAGHNAVVLEAATFDDWKQSPSGIRCPPNMSRILFTWGLGPEIVKLTSGRCPKITLYSAYTGAVLSELLYHEKLMEALEGEIFFLHHSDLLQMLYGLAVDAGAKFNFGSRVVKVNAEAPCVTLESGKKFHADLIVGADGHQSVLHPFLESAKKEREEINYTTYQCTIPVTLFKDDEGFSRLVKEPVWNVWMSSEWAVLGYGIRNNTEFAVSLVRKEDQEDTGVFFDWRKRIPLRDLDILETECEPLLKRILRGVNEVVRIKGDRTTVLETWSDSEGHLVVVGEAAHGWNPGSAHTAALGVEDAVVLGRLLSHLKSKSEVKTFLSAFQELRQPRSERVCRAEKKSVDLVALPPGLLRDTRDVGMRIQMAEGRNDWTSTEEAGYLRKCWEDCRDIFGYDAFDDADTWWVEWGVIFERMNTAATGTSSDSNSDPPTGDGFNRQVVVEQATSVL